MRLRVLAIGQKMPAWVDQGVEEYARRMPREISVEWLDIPPAKRGSATPEKYRVQEAEAIEAKLSGKAFWRWAVKSGNLEASGSYDRANSRKSRFRRATALLSKNTAFSQGKEMPIASHALLVESAETSASQSHEDA